MLPYAALMSFVHVMYRCESEGFRLRISKLLVPAQPQEVVTTGERSFLRMISLSSFHVSRGKSSSFKARTWRSLSVSLNGGSTSELPTAMECAVSSWDEAAVVRGLTCQILPNSTCSQLTRRIVFAMAQFEISIPQISRRP